MLLTIMCILELGIHVRVVTLTATNLNKSARAETLQGEIEQNISKYNVTFEETTEL